MYLKLIVRGLQRHRQSGKRLFILLALCSTVVLFCLAVRDSFTTRFQRLAIDTTTAHLQILPPESPKVQEMAFADQREGLVLLDYSRDLKAFLGSLPEVYSSMLAIETGAAVYSIEGEPMGFTPALTGVDIGAFAETLPGVGVLEGSKDLAYDPSMKDVPVFRPPLEYWEIIKDNDRFVRTNFRYEGGDWEGFKKRVLHDMPALFAGVKQRADVGLNDRDFLAGMNASLERTDLPSLLPERARARYDYAIDDALAALESVSKKASGNGPVSGRTAGQLRVLRKRLLQTAYPDAITPVRDTIDLNVPYTLAVPAARGDDPAARPLVLPITIAAYVQRIPMFFYNYYIDARALRDGLGLKENEGTGVFIRLKSDTGVPMVKKQIADWLAAHGSDYVVRDYKELGQLFYSVSTGFRVITTIIITLVAASVMIFIVNSVLVSLMKRRREIGATIAVGLSPEAAIRIMSGEMLVMVFLAWAVGSILGTGLILLLHRSGMPGVPFMPDGRLLLDIRPLHLAVSFAILIVSSALSSLAPLRRLKRAAPIELLKEAA